MGLRIVNLKTRKLPIKSKSGKTNLKQNYDKIQTSLLREGFRAKGTKMEDHRKNSTCLAQAEIICHKRTNVGTLKDFYKQKV